MTSIILDCDDVLLDWIGGFRQYAATRLQRAVEGEPQSWHMGEWLGTTDEVAFELVEEFNASEHFGNLKAVEGAREVVEIWKLLTRERNANFSLHVVTSCSSDPKTVAMRRGNLERLFGRDTFETIHCLDLGQPKKKLLQAWSSDSVWVEDNYKNALMGADLGLATYIRKRPHNAEYQDLHDERLSWFEHWSELEEYI